MARAAASAASVSLRSGSAAGGGGGAGCRGGGLGLGGAGRGLGGLGVEPGRGLFGRILPSGGKHACGLGLRQRPGCLGHRRISGLARLARHPVGAGEVGKPRRQRPMRLPRALGRRPRGLEVAPQHRKAVEGAQPVGRSTRRVLGGKAHPVPPPEIALPAHKPLAGREERLQPRAVLSRHDADPGEAAGEHGGGGDAGRERFCPGGQRRRCIGRVEPGPAGAARRIGLAMPQVVAERRPGRAFVARFDRDLVEKLRRPLPSFPLQKAGECGDLGPEGRRLALGGGERGAGFGLARLRVEPGGLGLGQRRLGAGSRSARGLERRRRRHARSGGARRLGRRGTGLGTGALCLGTGAGGGAAHVVDEALRRLMPGGHPRGIFGRRGERRLGCRERLGRAAGRRRAFRKGRVMAGMGSLKLCDLGLEPGDGVGRIAGQRHLARAVPLDLRRRTGQRLDRRRRLRGLGHEPVALDPRALQHGRGDRLFLAQRRQRGLRRPARLCRRTGGAVAAGDRKRRGLHRRHGRGPRRIRRLPAPPEEERLGPPQRRADLAVSRRLPCLPGERGERLPQPLEHILHPHQVRLGRLQAQFRLVPALVEARDPRRILEHAPTGARAGVDELGNLPLPDERRRARTRRRIGKEHRHVARPHLAPVRPPDRARVALDPARDLDLVGIVEADGRGAVGVVERHRDLGEGARRTAGRSGEDHVLHPLAAHRGRTILAHDPAKRLKQVRLAAAVRPDDARQPLADHEIGRVHEALEAVEAQAGDAHGSGSGQGGGIVAVAGGGVKPRTKGCGAAGQAPQMLRRPWQGRWRDAAGRGFHELRKCGHSGMIFSPAWRLRSGKPHRFAYAACPGKGGAAWQQSGR
jgi:hypothetical protein